METEHRVFVGNSNDLSAVGDDDVELVVTSPPYPMIEMWDDVFASLDPAVGDALDAGDGEAAFDLMHEALEATWDELRRVLVDGGIACINVGDATRTVDGSFRVYQNHARVTEYLDGLGFEPLPDILWRKPANSAAKFMGSGMLPPNAYATLEHEYLLVFRNGRESRDFESTDVRYESAYFWEERNEWFSDVWTDVTGTLQELADGGAGGGSDELRDRSAAYPLEIPYRLVNMYSTYGDTVLDPFWGTGTTTLAAMVAGRNSVGYELDEALVDAFDDDEGEAGGIAGVGELADATVRERLARHEEFVARRRADGTDFAYDAEHYDFPVTTKQERPMRLYTVDGVERVGGDGDDDTGGDGYGYVVSHSPYQRSDSAETAAERTHD